MVDILNILHNQNEIGKVILGSENGDFELRYKSDILIEDSISLSLPATNLTYIEKNFKLPPYFDMFIPEGYLFEVLKNLIAKKEGNINEQVIFSYLSQGIEGRISFKGSKETKVVKDIPALDEVIKNDSMDFFEYLVNIFLHKNAISGVQPKTIAALNDKGIIGVGDYIIKTFGKGYPYITINEFICLNICKKVGLETCRAHLSKNGNFLVVKRFNNATTGFEEACSLLGKRKEEKYSGSNEKLLSVIYNFSSLPQKDIEDFFKILAINYIVGNGDAHLKNFGLIFNDDFSYVRIAPVYDVVSTVAYIPDDLPALALSGKKSWNEWKDIKRFGTERCLIEPTKLGVIFNEIIDLIEDSYQEIDYYCKEFNGFKFFGERMKKFVVNSIKELKKEV